MNSESVERADFRKFRFKTGSFHEEHGGHQFDYSELCDVAAAVLVDDPSHKRGVLVSFARQATQHAGLGFALGIRTDVPHSISFTYDSIGSHDKERRRNGIGFSINGVLYHDKSVEAHYEQQFNQKFQAAATMVVSSPFSYLLGLARYTRVNWGAKLLYRTEEHLLGMSGLWALRRFPSLQLGGEAVFSFAKYMPGLSFGARRVGNVGGLRSVSTLTVSPISGHWTGTHTAAVTDNLVVSCRYEYNVHSTESDIALGLEIASAPRFKLRAGLVQGVAMTAEADFARVSVTLLAMCPFRIPPDPTLSLELKFA